MSEGYIFLHRKTQKHWVFERSEYLKAWIQMLFDATHQDYEVLVGNQLVRLKRGQFIFGRKAFAKKTGLSERSVRTLINRLKKSQMIDQQPTNKFSIISILNYDDYQTGVQQTSSKRPTGDQQATTNNNNNNNNNISAAPKLLEVEQYFHDKNCLELAEEFFEYWSERDWQKNGKPLARWRSNAATWIRNNKRFFGEEAVAKDEFEGFDHPIYGKLL